MNTPRAFVMAVVYEAPLGGVHVLVQTHRSVNGLKLYEGQAPEGTAHMFSWHLREGAIADAELQLRLGVEQLPN